MQKTMLRKQLLSILYKMNSQNVDMDDMVDVIDAPTLAAIKESFENTSTLDKIELFISMEKKSYDKSLLYFKRNNKLELMKLRIWLIKATFLVSSGIITLITAIFLLKTKIDLIKAFSGTLDILGKITGSN